MFSKKQLQSAKLPPTQDALHEGILRANYQAMVWHNDIVLKPEIPSPENNG